MKIVSRFFQNVFRHAGDTTFRRQQAKTSRLVVEVLEERILLATVLHGDRFVRANLGAMNLVNWIASESGGSRPGRGGVAINGTSAVLNEGNSFEVALRNRFTIGAAPTTISFNFTPLPANTTNPGMKDAFEAAFVDANGKSLVPTIGPGQDAFFNKTKSQSALLAPGVTYVGNTVRFSLAGLPRGAGTLILRLVNNDIDGDTSVTISQVKQTAGGAVPVVKPTIVANTAGREIDYSLLSDVSPSFVAAYGRTRFNDKTAELYADLSVKDIGTYLINTPLLVGVRNISNASVVVTNADGKLPDGTPYYDFTDLVAGQTLMPGSTSGARTISFLDPHKSAFTYDLVVLGQLNRAPDFTSEPNAEAVPGEAYVYQAMASDPDAGDLVSFSKLSGPSGLSINATTGLVTWTPQAGDLGTHAVQLSAMDGHGGTDAQAFTITVAPAPPNRPPIFTSTPVVDAGVAASFERVDIPVGDRPVGVALGDFDGSGKFSVVTANELDQTISLAEGNGDGSFDPSTGLSVGEPPPDPTELFVMPDRLPLSFPPPHTNASGVYGVAKGDFNGDGFLDVATTTYREVPFLRTYSLDMMLGNGNGTFQEPVQIASLPTAGYGILAKDFTHDGVPDLVVCVYDRTEVLFFKGLGNAAFATPLVVVPGNRSQFVQAGDLNNDNHLDIVSLNSNDANSSVSVFLGDGAGNFSAATTYGVGSGLQDLVIADINNDGHRDLVTANYSQSLTVWENDGTGAFVNRRDIWFTRPFGGISSPTAIFAGNYFGHTDGTIDLILATAFSGVERLRGDGAGNFTVINDGNPVYTSRYPIVGQPVRYFVENDAPDLNADGKPDIFFGYWSRGAPNTVTVGISGGDGTFTFKQFIASSGSGVPNLNLNGTWPGSPIAGDFNNDGVLDIAVGGINEFNPPRPGGVSLLLGTSPGDFAAPRDYFLPREVETSSGHLGLKGMTAIGDFNEDGIPDAAILTSSLSFAPGLGDGSFGRGVAVLPRIASSVFGVFNSQIRSADFNGDGHLDVVWLAPHGTAVALGNGAGGFTVLQVMPWQVFPGGPNDGTTGGQNLAVGDLNGDLHPDVVVRTWNYGSLSGNVEIWLYDPNANLGNGGFTYLPDSNLQMLLGRTPDDTIQHENGSNILLGDFDNDDILDLVVHAGPVSSPSNPGFVAERLFVWKGKHQAGAADASDVFDTPVNANPNPPIEARAGNGTGSFWESTAGDFNNDGNLDLAGVGIFSTWVLLGNGDHTFDGATRYEYGHWAIVNADLDRDGDLDLVLNHDGYGPNAVRRGRGDGTFGPLEFVSDPQGRGDSIIVHDLNGDGRLDLFESDSGNSAGAYNRFTVWLQPLPGLQAVATGDVDGDGKQDILAVNQANNRLKIQLGNGDNTFDRLHDAIVGRGPAALALGDLDGDAKLDAVTANELGNTISILLGNGNGTFNRTDLPTGRKPSSVAIGDVNGDGFDDIAVTNRDDNTLWLFMGQGGGAFGAPTVMPTGAQPSDVVLTDLDGDADLDLVVTNQGDNTVSIQYGDGAGAFTPALSVFAGNGPRSVAVGDINGDGRPDIVAANPTDNGVSLLLNQGSSLFGNAIPIRSGVSPMSVELADMNGDGKLDIITADAGSDTSTVLLNHFGIGAPYQYQATARDPDGDAVAFSLVSGPAGMSINSNGLVTWFPTSDQIGRNAVTLQADDGLGGTATQTFEINVTQTIGNHAPIIVSEPTTAILVDQTYSYPVHAVDGDNDAPQFSLTTAPAGMTIDRQTGQLDWDPRSAALSFDGNDRVVIPDSPSLRPTNLTLEGWFQFEGTNTAILVQKSIVNTFYRASYQLWYDQANSTLNAGVGRNDATGLIPVTASFTPVLGRWYHIAFTFDDSSDTQVLYLDGGQVATSATTQTPEYSADPIVLGHHSPDFYTDYWRGTMDEIRLWDSARSQAQIQAGMGRKLMGNEPGLAALYHMDEGQGNKILDATSNHNDGTLGDSGIGTRVPTWTSGISPLGDHAATVRVEDGKGGFDEQSFRLTITNAAPAGISGRVFDDIVGTPGLATWVVFLDQNANGIRDGGEPSATTDVDGLFTITGLPAGTYHAQVEGQPGWSPTTPAGGAKDIVLAPGQGIAFLDQYASSVIAKSNEYGLSPGNYSAAQTLGAPNVFTYGDSPNAWTTNPQNSGTHFLIVGYGTPVLADGVTVRENLGNGFVTQIDVLDMNNVLHTVWTGVDPSQPGTVADFRVNFPRTDYLVQGVKVYVDTNLDTYYEEIDAISLHGIDPTQLHNFGVQTVAAGQRPPAFVGAALANAQVGQDYVYQPVVANPDGRPLTFDLLVKPEGMAVDPATGAVGWTPGTPQVGPQRVLLRVLDDRGLLAIQDFTVGVIGPNTAPIIASNPPTPAIAGLPYEYHVLAQDAEGGLLQLNLDAGSLALGMTIDSNGVVRWTPAGGDVGPTHSVVVTVTDPQGAANAQAFNLPVVAAAANDAPVVTSTPRTQIGLGNTYVYDVRVADPNGDPLTFSLPTHPAGMTIDANGRVTWTPPAVLGPNAVTVSVSDGRSPAVTQTFTVAVVSQNPNHAPVFVSHALMIATAGETYAYDAQVTDAEGDPVEFSLDVAPAGLSVHPRTGTLRWIPMLDQLGANNVTVRVIDAQGGSATQSFVVTERGAHVPPIITSSPPTAGSAGSTYLYPVKASAPQGAILTFSLLTKPAAMAIDAQTGLISWTPNAGDVGTANVLVQVDDGQGGSATQAFTIVVAASAPNLPPSITSPPPLVATVGAVYTYSIQATDPDGGPSPLNFQVLLGPASMTVNAASGLVQWTPSAGDIGASTITVGAFDGPAGTGGAGLQTFTLQVTPVNNPPRINSGAITQATAGNLYRYDVRASDPNGDALSYALTTAPAGMTIDGQGRIRWQTAVANIGVAPVTVEVRDPRGAVVTQSFNVTVSPDTLKPQVAIILSRSRANIGDLALVRVVAADNVGVASLQLTLNGTPIALDAQGSAALDTSTAGFFALVATATDAVGNFGTANAAFNVVDPNVVNGPTIAITSPADGAVITDFTDVIGTVTDTIPTTYKLFLRPADAPDSAFVQFASGAGNIVNGKLGTIDPSLLTNDAYVLRLVASNAGGLQSILEQNISIAGNLKLGDFQLAFNDMTIPVSGIPITLLRTYDTLNAARQGDFGFGWRLDYRNTDLRTSLPKSGAEIFGLYTPLQFGTKVYITLPGGQREGFTFTPDQHGLFQLTYFTPRFTPDAGVTNQLSVDNVYLSFDGSQFVTLNGQIPYNPASPDFGGGYTLTTKDGIAYKIDGNTGLLNSVTDRNHNTLTFSDAGITSPAGPQVKFERDAQGRITAAIDPNGKRLAYTYSTAGDLASVTDRDGNVTKFQYDPARAHYISRVIDPLGRSAVRTAYDAQGRLVKTIDANGSTVTINYDPAHSLETITNALGFATTYEYDAQGNVVRKIDALGGITQNTFDASGNPLTTTDPLGNTQAYTYDNAGNVLTATDELGNVSYFVYNQFADLLSATNPLGNTQVSQFDNRGNIVAAIDALGNRSAILNDGRGNVTEITRPDGSSHRQAFDVQGQLNQQIDGLGGVTTLTRNAVGDVISTLGNQSTPAGVRAVLSQTRYDANNQVIAETDALGNVTQYQYDAAGNRVTLIDPLGRRTRFVYDADNHLIKTTYPDGTTEAWTYDAAGNQISFADRAGRITNNQYDKLGRLTVTIYPDNTPGNLADNPRTSIEYDAAGNVTAKVDELGHRTTYGYDAAGNQVSIRDALGNQTQMTYDAAGNQTTVTDALGRLTRFFYDAGARLVKAIYADGNQQTIAYDDVARTIATTNELGHVTIQEYDAGGRLIATVDALGGRTVFTYDELGCLIAKTDALGRTTSYEYDALGNLTATVLPLGQRATNQYDGVRNLIGTTDFNGNTIRNTYDALNRLTLQKFPDGTSNAITYTATGQRRTVTDARGVTTYAYDVRDRLTSRTDPDGSFIRYGYDLAGHIISITTPAGATQFAFDAANRLTTVTAPDGGLTRYSYDGVGNVVQISEPDGTVETRTYDLRDQLISQTMVTSSAALLTSLAYTRDAAGNVLSAAENTGRIVTYAYDSLGRLVAENITDPLLGARVMTYAYDAVGNRLAATDSVAGNSAYSYDANDRLLSVIAATVTTTYTYDANGNALTVQTGAASLTTYTWDFQNRLKSVVITGAGATQVSYQYDVDGVRVSATTGGQVTRFLVDTNRGIPVVIEEYTPGPTRTIKTSYVVGLGLVSERIAGANRFYHADQLGSIRFLTNGAGVVTDTYVYEAFGQVLHQTGTTPNVYLYAAQPRDLATGLDYLQTRYLSPSTGRFVSMDTELGDLDNPLTMNRYLYVTANPVNRIDPTGEKSLTVAEFLVATAISTIISVGATAAAGLAREKGYTKLAYLFVAISWLPTLLSAGAAFKGILVAGGNALARLAARRGAGSIFAKTVESAIRTEAIAIQQQIAADFAKHGASLAFKTQVIKRALIIIKNFNENKGSLSALYKLKGLQTYVANKLRDPSISGGTYQILKEIEEELLKVSVL